MEGETLPHKCERCDKEVNQWWLITANHKPSRAMTCFYLCNACMERFMYYVKERNCTVKEFVSEMYKVKEKEESKDVR